ncbi:MAG: uncharacterized protein KVP18_002195 [Porospora cf. gigantea A]|nr:MAG: hypothetical protein KVP18_002195 [Porospora cf. gigantea A]
MHASGRHPANSLNLLASIGQFIAPTSAAIQSQTTDLKTQQELNCELPMRLCPATSLISPMVSDTPQESEERRYLLKFWLGIYASSAAPYVRMIQEDLASITGNTPLTWSEMSFLFAYVCGLSPIFNVDSETGRLETTDKKRVTADFSSFDDCEVSMLTKLSAWHWLQMYDDGLLEPTSKPSTILSCLGHHDRMQYLREMTSTRSVPWLEQARWLAVDCMEEATSQSSTRIITDMSLLLQLLESRGRWDSEYLNRRVLVVQLGLYFISTRQRHQRSLLTYYILQAFNAIRCDALDCKHAHRERLRALTLEMDSQTLRIGLGWEAYALALGIESSPPVDGLLRTLQSGGYYPLFLNPFLLASHNWDDVKDSPSFHGYSLSIRWLEHIFPCGNDLFDMSGFVAYEAQPSSITALRSLLPQQSPAGGLPAPISPSSRLEGSHITMDIHRATTLDAVRRVITRFDGDLLNEFSTDSSVHQAIRKQLATAVVAGCSAAAELPEEPRFPVCKSNHMLDPLIRTGCMCFCLQGLQPEEIRIATERMFSLYTNKTPTWQEAGPQIERWWKLAWPNREFDLAAESFGYVSEPKTRVVSNESIDSNSTHYSTASEDAPFPTWGATSVMDTPNPHAEDESASPADQSYRLRADKLLRTLERRRAATATFAPRPRNEKNTRPQTTPASTTPKKSKGPKFTKKKKKKRPQVAETDPVTADEQEEAESCLHNAPPVPALLDCTQMCVGREPRRGTFACLVPCKRNPGAELPIGHVKVVSCKYRSV